MSAPDANWRLVWADEFNGNSLDHGKWSIGVPWNGPDGSNRFQDNNNQGYIQDSNVVVSDGTLKLIANKQDVTGSSGRVFHYTEGAIHTANSFSTTYGYFEIRRNCRRSLPARGPGSGRRSGCWGGTAGRLRTTWPSGNWAATARTRGWRNGSADQVHWNDINSYTPLPTGFHTYGMQWGPGYQIFYLDGHITHRVLGGMVPAESMYMLLNNAISAGGRPILRRCFPTRWRWITCGSTSGRRARASTTAGLRGATWGSGAHEYRRRRRGKCARGRLRASDHRRDVIGPADDHGTGARILRTSSRPGTK